MSKGPRWLLDLAADTHSQSGEDGVISHVLSLLPESDGWCVEVGAWDGVHLSNTRKLLEERGFRGVLIEGDERRFRALEENCAANPRVHAVRAFVGWGEADGLDPILSRFEIPSDFDLLSIDIDGNDYHLWDAVKRYRAKVVCIEFNPTIPTEVDFVQPADPRVQQGSSLLALDRLARAKDYELVCVLPWNAIFVDRRYYARFEIADNRPHVLRADHSAVTWLFSGYDGTVHLAGARRMPWHGVALDERDHQILPRVLRRYPGSYPRVVRLLLGLLKKLGALRV